MQFIRTCYLESLYISKGCHIKGISTKVSQLTDLHFTEIKQEGHNLFYREIQDTDLLNIMSPPGRWFQQFLQQ